MMDDAFTAMELSGKIDSFEVEYEKVKGKLAKDIFKDDDELLRLLQSKAARLETDGLKVSLFMIFIMRNLIDVVFF